MKYDKCSKCQHQFADPKSGKLRCLKMIVVECVPVACCHQYAKKREA